MSVPRPAQISNVFSLILMNSVLSAPGTAAMIVLCLSVQTFSASSSSLTRIDHTHPASFTLIRCPVVAQSGNGGCIVISHSRVNRSRKYESTVFDCLSSDFKDMNNFKSEISCSDVEELRVINLHYSVCFRIGYDYALRTGSLDGFDVFLCDLSCQDRPYRWRIQRYRRSSHHRGA